MARTFAKLTALGDSGAFPNAVTEIVFPAMPETLELAREANYQVTSPLPLPDGIHIYQSVNPFTIPFNFKVHAFDDEVTKGYGASYLLQTAALLHALVIPIRDGVSAPDVSQAAAAPTGRAPISSLPDSVTSFVVLRDAARAQAAAQQASNNPGAPIAQTTSNVATAQAVVDKASSQSTSINVAAPPVCRLQLISNTSIDSTTSSSLNVLNKNQCFLDLIGYVRSVNVKLKGPWLYADDGSYNLPSSAEYSFTFVHAPGYRNRYSKLGEAKDFADLIGAQVFSADMATRFLGQKDQSTIAKEAIKGIFSGGSSAAPSTPNLTNLTGLGF